MKIFSKVLVVALCCLVGGAAWYVASAERGDITIPEPEARPFETPPPVPDSTLGVLFEVPLAELQAVVSRELAADLDGTSPVNEGALTGTLAYRVRADGTPKVSGQNGRLRIDLPIAFSLRLDGTASGLGLSLPIRTGTEGALTVTVSLAPRVDEEWNVRSDPKLSFRWRRSPQVEVLGARISIESVATEYLEGRMQDVLPRIEEAVSDSLRLRERAEEIWKDLFEPRLLTESPDLRLFVEPRAIFLARPEVDGHSLRFRLSMTAGLSLRGGTLSGESLSASSVPPLPPLVPSVAPMEGVFLRFPVAVAWEELSDWAQSEAAGRPMDLGDGSEVIIRKVRVFGNGDRLAAAVDVEAERQGGLLGRRTSGRIYLEGRPDYDSASRVLGLREFDFDENTTSGLARAAAWLAKPLLVRRMEESLRFPLAEKTDEAKELLRRALENLTNEEMSVSGDVHDVTVEGLFVTPQALEVALAVSGDARMVFHVGP